MNNKNNIRLATENRLQIARSRLACSYDKVKRLSAQFSLLDDDSLETWESFASRFSRLTDIFLSRYLRVRILEVEPAFRGTFRDAIDQAEKLSIVTNADKWFSIRELRNKAAHDYDDDDVEAFYRSILVETPFVMAELERVLAGRV